MVGNKRDLALSSLRHVRFPHSLTAGAIPFSSIPATAQGKRFSIFETGVRISEESEGIRWVKAATREREGHFLDLTSEVPEPERSTHPARLAGGAGAAAGKHHRGERGENHPLAASQHDGEGPAGS